MYRRADTRGCAQIDANDDGGIEWDEFLTYIVHDAGAKLEQVYTNQRWILCYVRPFLRYISLGNTM